ncbi:MAG: polysaccharide biosynthesis tyrosine autokinase [Nevskiaceae bacterium]|nr:MAG: polysaccharide biosynthesis tyrosine autokinase [Nevskiaceae bacterium]
MNDDSSRSIANSHSVGNIDEEIDLAQIFSVIYAAKWAIVASVVLAIFIGGGYFVATEPVYESNGTVQVEQENNSLMLSSMSQLSPMLAGSTETEAELQILRSRMVLSKVVDNLNLELVVEPKYFPLVGSFVARRGMLGNGLVPPFLGATSYAWGGEVLEVARFEVPSEWLGEPFTLTADGAGGFLVSDADGLERLRGKAGEQAEAPTAEGKGRLQIFVRDLKARAGTQFVITRISFSDALNGLAQNLAITEQGKKSGILNITAKNTNKKLAADVVRQVQDAYLRQNVERRSEEAEKSLEFLRQQLPAIKAETDAAQAKLNAYQLKQGSVNVTKETELVLQEAVSADTERMRLIGQRQEALQRYTPQHPVIVALDAQIQLLQGQRDSIKKRSETLPETQQEILSLMRDLEVSTQIYTTLLNSAQELQVSKAGTIGNVRIIDYPLVPEKKIKPKGSLVLALSVFAGLFLGISYALVRNLLNRGVSRPDELERATGIPTYAAIPFVQEQRKLSQLIGRGHVGDHILASVDQNSVAVEAIRSLRASLQFALLESPNNVIMFTGPTPGLGKSFLSINLSAVLAASGKRVVLLDCDMRRGHLKKYIAVGANIGLSNYISGTATLDQVLNQTPVPGLTLITNGVVPPNPAELLAHERFIELLNKLSASYDYVILDTPPVLPVADAMIIGRLAGCVLLVLKEAAHPMRIIEETVRRLRQSGVQIRGAVFNQVGLYGGGYGYYSSYGYSYTEKYASDSR